MNRQPTECEVCQELDCRIMEMEILKRSKKKGKSSQYVQMDENVYQEHILNLKRKYAKTIREIEKYTVKTIHWAAKEIDQERLNETNNAVKKFVDEVKKVRSQLDRKLDKERFDAVNKFRLDIKEMRVDNEAEIKRRFSKPEASRSEPDKIETKKQIQPNSILKEKSSETPVKVEKAKVDVSKVEALVEEKVDEVNVHEIEASDQIVKKVEVDVPTVEDLVVLKVDDADDIDVGECLIKAADLCCQDEKVAVPNCSAISTDVKGSTKSDDKVEAVKSVKDDWKYRREMWWLNFRRKIVYDKIRSKKSFKTVKKNLNIYENGIHEFVEEYKDVEGCDIRGWKKRLAITKTDVRNYVTKLKSNCKVNSRCAVKIPDVTISSVNSQIVLLMLG